MLSLLFLFWRKSSAQIMTTECFWSLIFGMFVCLFVWALFSLYLILHCFKQRLIIVAITISGEEIHDRILILHWQNNIGTQGAGNSQCKLIIISLIISFHIFTDISQRSSITLFLRTADYIKESLGFRSIWIKTSLISPKF